MSNNFKVNNCAHPQHLSMISDNLDKVIRMYNNGEITTKICYTMKRTRWDDKKFMIEVYVESGSKELIFNCIY